MKIKAVYTTLLGHFGPQGWWPLTTQAGKLGFDEQGYHKSMYFPYTEEHQTEISVGASHRHFSY